MTEQFFFLFQLLSSVRARIECSILDYQKRIQLESSLCRAAKEIKLISENEYNENNRYKNI